MKPTFFKPKCFLGDLCPILPSFYRKSNNPCAVDGWREKGACTHRHRRPSYLLILLYSARKMPTAVKDTLPCGLIAHAMRGKPDNKRVYAWDAPNHCDSSPPDKHNGIVGENEDIMFEEESFQQQQQQPSFYDREALQEKLHGLQAERSRLSERENELRERLEKAQVTLSSMRSQKRQLSTAKLLDQAGGNGCPSDKQRPCLSRDGIHYRRQEEHRKDGKAQRQDDKNVRLWFQHILL